MVLSILAGVAGPLLGVSIDLIGLHTDRVDLEESASLALSRMSREIRRLRDDESIITANAGTFSFIDIDGTQIRYRQVGNSLMRREGTGSDSSLADHVQTGGLSFAYYDDDGNLIASPLTGLGTRTDIRRIEIQIVFRSGNHTLPARLQVRPRNLRHEADRFF